MDKKLLEEYIDACELVKETEDDIRKLRKREVVHDKVNGSNPEFPFQRMSFHISGVTETCLDKNNLEKEKKLLIARKLRAEKIKIEVEQWMNTIPVRIQRIIRYKIFERNSWEQVARRMGGNVTADSVRKQLENFLKEK